MPISPSPTRIPDSDARPVSIEDAVNPYVKLGVRYWQSLRGERRFPARVDMTLRGMSAILPFSVILSVIDDGADFEFRYVGDYQRQAFGVHFKGMRLSQIEAAVPELGKVLRAAYEQARSLGEPFIIRGRVDENLPDTTSLYHETAFLPLGASDLAVDHLLLVGVQVPAPFWRIPKAELKVIEGNNPA